MVEVSTETTREAGIINCAAYENGRRVADLALGDIQQALARPESFVWVGLYEPESDLLRRIQDAFGLHDLAVEDALSAHQRPKLERYDEALFVVLRTVQRGADGCLEFGETHVFVGRQYIVTVRHGSIRSHVGLRSRCEAAPQLLTRGSGFVLYALMDFVVDQYFPVVAELEDELEAVEEEVFGDDQFSRSSTQRIYRLKRDLLAVKRAIWPLIDVCNRLTRYDVDLIPEDTRPYFRDVYDHVIRINEMVDSSRELLSTALEANLSLISVAQNEDVRRLAAWAAIIALPTMIAGLYGMNFQSMPELHWTYGYPAALALMAGGCVALYAAFKRSRWL